MRTGRPSSYTIEAATVLCELIPTWDKSLDKLCKSDDRLPGCALTVYGWLAKHEDFAAMYARAKAAQAERLAEEMLEIADTPQIGVRTKEGKDGVDTFEEDMLGHRKLQIDTRKWLLAKLQPRKYGDKLDITSNNEHVNGKELTAAEREARAASIAAAAAARMKKVKPDVDPFS